MENGDYKGDSMNVLGKVKYEVIEKLFQAGYFPCPEDIEKILEGVRENYVLKDYHAKMKEFNNRNKLFKRFSEKPEITAYDRTLLDMPLGAWLKGLGLQKYYYKAQDIKVVLETLCVAKNSQSNNIMADSSKLRTLQRVVDNPDEYLNLLKNVKNELT